MKLREKFAILAEGARGTIKNIGAAAESVNKWQRTSGFADPDRLANLGSDWGMPKSGFGFEGSMKAKPKPKRKRKDEMDVDRRDIHIHVHVPRPPKYRY